MKRITILTASSGGGHNAAASALQELISKHFNEDCHFDIIDIYQNSFFNKLPLLATIRYKSDKLWQLFLSLTNHKLTTRLMSKIMRPSMLRTISPQLPEECDYLIAVHFNPAHCLEELAKQFIKKPKTAIVITDFDPHWAWVGGNADSIYTISKEGVQKAKNLGYKEAQIHRLSLVPSQAIPYKTQLAVKAKREKLKIGLVSGQDGSNAAQIKTIIEDLNVISHSSNIELSVFCGKNIGLKNELKTMDCNKGFVLNVHGYTENLSARFHCFDLMIIRTSPGILSECIMAGVPVLGFQWSAHESYQTQFISKHGIGMASRKTDQILQFIQKLRSNPSKFEELQQTVSKLRERQNNQAFMTHLLTKEAA